jgi:tetratricopeptide (TPR) repeat protein
MLGRTLGVYRRIGDSHGMSRMMNNLGDNALRRGELDKAETFLVSALQAARSLGAPARQSVAHQNLGWLALLRGDHQLSAQHLRQALDLAQGLAHQLQVTYPYDLPVDERIGSLKADLGKAEFTRLVAKGTAMDLDAAIAYARGDVSTD